ncbi:hypothetical protein GCM10025870_32060 [Agromyces marinus]|uniref:Uncharacterized protein n=1 Tax=Agromyces marinus TaxID=1389020 RepID=A0ABM8H5R2_9MICO|nr:hypothetical protein GCM10025870_32060 [Agromyces marinus]
MLEADRRDGALAELERAREGEVEARLRLETARERVRSEETRIAGMERQHEAERRAAEEAARRTVIRRAQLESAQRVADALPAVLSAAGRSVAEARVALAAAEAERASRNEEVQTARRAEASVRERLHAVTEDVHGLELRIYEKKLHVGSLVERAASELGLDEAVLVAEYGPDQPIPDEADPDAEPRPYDRTEQQRRLQAAERKLGQLGRVNPLALEEFAALEQRHQFLTEQLTDLANTRKDLLTIIEEIDGRMESIFRSAFEDTREAFAEVFPILFPGGEGRIALTNPDDLLTTGIEVSVKPAGKKIERLSLLSGGERSSRPSRCSWRSSRPDRARSTSWTRSRPRSTTPTSAGCSRRSRACARRASSSSSRTRSARWRSRTPSTACRCDRTGCPPWSASACARSSTRRPAEQTDAGAAASAQVSRRSPGASTRNQRYP